MRQLEIVMAVLQQGEHYLLQLRNGDPKIGAAGLMGCFGGKLEVDEEPIEAVCRELCEETNLRPQTHQVSRLGQVRVISDHRLEPVEVHAHVFHLPLSAEVVVEALEGELVRLNRQEAMAKLHLMTPGTRACYEELIKE